MPAITVAITCHNLEKYIGDCIKQLRGQTFQDFEILVYDDCSTDRSREILQHCKQELGESFELILGQIPQKLPGRSRNMLLDSGKIRGEYIVFLDGDDVVEPDFLEKLYSTAVDSGAEIAVCAYDRFEDDSGHVLCIEMQGYPPLIRMEQEQQRSLAFINTSLWNKLIRVDTIGTLRMPEFSVGEDASFLQAVYMGCSSIAFVDQVLIHYRVRRASVISNTPEQSIYSFAKELHRLWEQAETQWMKDNIALADFVHIGLSMPLRAHDNPDIDTSAVLSWVRRHLAEDFGWYRKNRYMRPGWLLGQGIKGLGIYGAFVCHRLGCFSLFLWAYKTVTQSLHIDIKF